VTPVSSGQSRYEIGDIGVFPNVHPSIRAINAGEPAEKAGLKPNDVIEAVDGKTITFRPQLIEIIAKHPAQTITITVLRNDQHIDIPVTPAAGGCTRRGSRHGVYWRLSR